MHAPFMTASELVPVVTRHLELGLWRHAQLGQGKQVLEASLARHLLAEEPAHLLARGLLGQPGEERIALSGAVVAQPLEPTHEAVGITGRPAGNLLHRCPFGCDEAVFQAPIG